MALLRPQASPAARRRTLRLLSTELKPELKQRKPMSELQKLGA
jgi:hypothetical protein